MTMNSVEVEQNYVNNYKYTLQFILKKCQVCGKYVAGKNFLPLFIRSPLK